MAKPSVLGSKRMHNRLLNSPLSVTLNGLEFEDHFSQFVTFRMRPLCKSTKPNVRLRLQHLITTVADEDKISQNFMLSTYNII